MVYTSESEVIALVDAFHKRSLSPTKWDHAAQLTVTLYYGMKFPYAIAFDLLKEGIKWVTVHQSVDTANQDTAIHYWLQNVKSFAIKYRNIDDLSALANILIATYRDSEMPYDPFVSGVVFEAGRPLPADTKTLELPVKRMATVARA